eukprot:g2518.t1
MPREQTYIMVKPDGVQRGIVGNIISRFEKKGFKLVGLKLVSPSKAHLEKHYADLKSKSFFPSLIQYMMMGPVCAMVWEGDNVVLTGRKMLGATNPKDSAPGTIRGDLCIHVGRNICHGSDSVDSAKKEISLWFPEGLNYYSSASEKWVYEKPAPKKMILLGMGNPLLDISAEVPQSEFQKWGAKPGDAMLAEEKHASMYADLIKSYKVEYIAGGATQNSIRYGEQLKVSASKAGVNALYLEDADTQTGTCAVLIKDKERSLVANLAAANKYTPEKHMALPAVKSAIESAEFFYISGFFMTVSPPAMQRIATHAAQKNKIFSLNLAAPFLMAVPPFRATLEANLPYCDIVFGNETEAAAFAENFKLEKKDVASVAQHIAGLPKVNKSRPRICCITQGATATVVSIGGKTATSYPVKPIQKSLIVDTNGAGDAFVGGFFSKYVTGASLSDCVETGHETAGLIIQQSGCKLPPGMA